MSQVFWQSLLSPHKKDVRPAKRSRKSSAYRSLMNCESLEQRILLTAIPTPLRQLEPTGSLVYQGRPGFFDSEFDSAGETDSFTIDLDAGQTASVVVTPFDPSIQSRVELHGPGASLLASVDASAAGERVLIPVVAAATAGTYQIDVSNLAGVGFYDVMLLLNSSEELEAFGEGSNDTTATAQNIGNTAVSVSGSSDRLAVRGRVGSGSFSSGDTVFSVGGESNELFTVDPHSGDELDVVTIVSGPSIVTGATGLAIDPTTGTLWALLNLDDSNDSELVTIDPLTGQATRVGNTGLRLTAPTFDSNGTLFAVMDGDSETLFTLDKTDGSLTFVQDLFGDDQGEALAFNPDDGLLYRLSGEGDEEGEVPGALRALFSTIDTATAQETRMGVSGDQFGGVQALTYSGNGSFLMADGFELFNFDSSGHSYLIGGLPNYSSGLAFVPGPITTITDPSDVYQLSLTAGQSATVVVDTSGLGLTLELLDSTGTPVAQGVVLNDVIDQAIYEFQIPTTGDYFVQVSAPGFVDYQLVVTRGTAFGLQANRQEANTQHLAISSDVLGALQPPQLFAVNGNAGGLFTLGRDTGALQFVGDTDYSRVVDLAFRDDGVLFASANGGYILTLDPATGVATELAVKNTDSIHALEFDAAGNLFATMAGAFGTVDVATGQFTQVSLPNVGNIGGLAVDPISGTLYGAGSQNGRVYSVDPLTGDFTLLFSSDFSSINSLAFDSAGTLFGGTGSRDDQQGVLFTIDLNSQETNWVAQTGVSNLAGLSFQPPGGADHYSFFAAADDVLQIQTSIPLGDPNSPANSIDPELRLFDSAGNLVAMDANSHADGKNAILNYTVPTGMSGIYRLEIASEAAPGEYLVSIDGATAETLAPISLQSAIAEGAVLNQFPAQLDFTFSSGLLLTSLAGTDVTVNGQPASAFMVQTGNQIRFDIASLAAGDGIYNVQVATGNVTSLQGAGNAQFDLTFRVDTTGPSVTTSSVSEGDILSAGDVNYAATFSEPLQLIDLGTEDVVLQSATTGQVFPISNLAYDAPGQLLTFDMLALAEDNYVLTLASGPAAFRDLLGNELNGGPSFPLPSGQGDLTPDDFVIQFSVDAADRTVPTPLRTKLPFGSLIDDSPIEGVFHGTGDADVFTIDIDADQRITLVVEPLADFQASQLRPAVELFDPSGTSLGTASASVVGERAFLQTISATTAGSYTIAAQSHTGPGAYRLFVILNAAAELEDVGTVANDSMATAQNIDSAFMPLIAGASHLGILGTADGLKYSQSHTESGTLYHDNVLNISFTETLQPTSDAVLTITAKGELSGTSQFLTIAAEGLFSQNVFVDDGADTPNTTQITISQNDLAALSADGTIEFSITPNANVFPIGGTFLTLDLEYSVPIRPDVYSVSLLQGETISLAATSQSLEPLLVELADAAGGLLAKGDGRFANVTQAIADFVVPADGVYHVSVAGAGEYSLLVTRDATFNFESNATQPNTQFIGQTNQVLAATGVIVVEPDDFANSAVIDVPGVTLSVVQSAAETVTSSTDPDASTGGQVISRNGNQVYYRDNSRTLQADFDNPVSGIAIDILSDSGGDFGIIEVFDVDGNLLQTAISETISAGEFATLSISRPTADIARVRATGLASFIKLDNLRVLGDANDTLTFVAAAGDELDIRTVTPGDGPNEPVNLFDPRMTLSNPDGQIVGIDDNSAVDGRNARIQYTVPAGGDGLYTLDVAGNHRGSYIVQVTGATGTVDAPPTVAATFPVEASKITSSSSFPIELTFNEGIRFDSVDATDLVVDGGVTVNDVELVDARTVRFIANVPDVEAVYSFQLVADSLTDLQGTGNVAYQGTFEIDRMGPRVTSNVPTAQASAPFNQLTLHFDDLINGATFLPEDVTLTGPGGDISGQVTGITVNGNQATILFNSQTVPGFYTFDIGPNVQDIAGNPMDQNANGTNGEAGDNFVVQINLQSPDLAVQSLGGPASAVFGDAIVVNFTVANTGDDPAAEGWVDRIWLSSDNVLGGDIELKTVSPGTFVPLASGTDYSQSVSVPLPLISDLSDGDFFILIQTDSGGTQPEASETNNVMAHPIQLALPPIPDLIVSDIVAPVEALSGQQIPITWTVTNQGTGPATGTWNDAIFVTDDGTVTKLFLEAFEFVGTIPAGGSVTRTQNVTLPINASGIHAMIIATDFGDVIFEHAEETNNTLVDVDLMIVELAPFANLQVTDITIPASGMSGQQLGVEWIVTNNGTGSTSYPLWFDEVYLSVNSVLDSGDIKLGRVANPGFLAAGDSYVNGRTVTLPNGFDGDFYLLVKTDVSNVIFESDFENDNTLSAVLDVQLTPPPDVQVVSVEAPSQTFSGERIGVHWTVENLGANVTNVSRWTDRIYLSTDTTLDAEDLQLSQLRLKEDFEICHQLLYGVPLNSSNPQQYNPDAHRSPFCALSGGLDPNEAYDMSASVLIPPELSGDYFILVQTDVFNDVFEHAFEDNNVGFDPVAVAVTLTPPPDLEFVSASAAATAIAGLPVSVDYEVGNLGSTATPGSKWQDRIYLSTDNVFDAEDDVLLGSRRRSGSLNVDATYAATFDVTVPVELEGDYFVFVVTDFDDDVFELNNVNNVFELPNTIAIASEPADLVASFTAPATGVAGEAILVDWSVLNSGIGLTETDRWIDTIVLSTDDVFDETDTVVLTREHVGALDVSEGYDVHNHLLQLPIDVIGNLFLLVSTDSGDSVFEDGMDANNVAVQAITVSESSADLQVTNVTIQPSVVAGQNLLVGWTVQNLGASTTDAFAWVDRIYLSTDSVLDEDDRPVKTVQRNGQLLAADSYNRAANVTIPLDFAGPYFVIVATDVTREVFEGDGPNEDNNFNAASVTVTAASVPDLIVSNVDAPATAVSGQLLPLTWTVRNVGDATAASVWQDAIYLSLDQILDPADTFIGNVIHSEALAVNEEYIRQESFNLPRGLAGPFYVFVRTDFSDAVAELSGEDNNVNYDGQSVEIQLLPPADLVVGTITLPGGSVSGQNAAIEYTVHNQGTETAFGSWRDSIYISADDTWDVGDALFARTAHNGDVAGGSSYTESVGGTLPGVIPGDYFVIIRSDIRNAIPETSEANNIGASLNQFSIDVEQLLLDTPYQQAIGYNQSLFLQIEVPEDETLRISTSGGSASMFVSFGRLPSQADHDFRSELLTTAGEVLIADSEAGTYYVLVLGGHTFGNPVTTVLAEALDFEVFDVNFGIGGNVGNRTIEINGARFDRSVTAELSDGDGFQLAPESYHYVDETRLFATFNLQDVSAGQYDVRVSNTDGGTTTITNGLTVVDGGGGTNRPSLQLPSATRRPVFDPAFPFHYFSTWGNSGINDVAAPLLFFSSTAPISLTQDVATDVVGGLFGGDKPSSFLAGNEIVFFGVDDDGPAGILMPGDFEEAIIHSLSDVRSDAIHVLVDRMGKDTNLTFDWSFIRDALVPDGMSDEDFDPIYAQMISQVGSTWGDYLNMLARNASLLPPEIGQNSDPGFLVELEFRKAQAALGTSIAGFAFGKDFDIDISGRAVEARNLTTGESFATLSLNDGTFFLSRVTPGNYEFRFDGAIVADSPATSVSDGQSLVSVQLTLEPGSILTGATINDESGLPISGAAVSATHADGTTFVTTSLEDGSYTLEGLIPGIYTIRADAAGRARTEVVDFEVIDSKYSFDLSMPVEALLSGTVDFEAGGPTDSLLQVAAYPAGSAQRSGAYVGATDGATFVINGLPVGQFDVVIRREGYLTKTLTAVDAVSGSTLDLGDTTLQIAGSITGTVTSTSAGDFPASLNIGVFLDGEPIDGSPVAADGSYDVPNLEPGNYSVRVLDAVDSVSAEVNVVVAAGESVTGVDLNVTPGGVVEGVVEDLGGTAVPGIRITIETPDGVLRDVVTSQTGEFRFERLGFGQHRVSLPVSGIGSSQTVNVTAVDGDVFSAALVFSEVARVEGRLLRDDASAVADGDVNLLDNGKVVATTRSDLDGNYAFRLVRGGSFTVQAVAATGTFTNTEVLVTAGETTTHDLVAGTGSLAISIDGGGHSIIGARVTIGKSAGDTNLIVDSQAVLDGLPIDVQNLASGTYVIDVRGSGNLGGEAIVAITNGVASSVTITLQMRSQLTGVVTDGNDQPVGEAFVSLRSTDGHTRRFAATLPDGTYSIESIPDGAFDLSVVVDGKHAAITENLEITADRVLNVTTEASTTTLAGQLTDNNTLPIPLAEVVVTTSDGLFLGSTRTDSNGQYVVQTAHGSNLSLFVSADGYADAEILNVNVQQGTTTNIATITVESTAIGQFTPPDTGVTASGSAFSGIFSALLTLASESVSDPGHLSLEQVVPLPPERTAACATAHRRVVLQINQQNVYRDNALEFQSTLRWQIPQTAVVVGLETAIIMGKLAGLVLLAESFGAISIGAAAYEFQVAAGLASWIDGANSIMNDLRTARNASTPQEARARLQGVNNAIVNSANTLAGLTGTVETMLDVADDRQFFGAFSRVIGLFTTLRGGVEGIFGVTESVAMADALIKTEQRFRNALAGYKHFVVRANIANGWYNTCLQTGEDPGKNMRLPPFPGRGPNGEPGSNPNPDGEDPDDEGDIDRPASVDPNDILGPDGVGDLKWVSVNDDLRYTIRFENDAALADAPAQVVRVTQQLDDDLDFRTFRVGDFGFGDVFFDVPDNRPVYQDRLDLTEQFGIFVDVFAGIDVTTGEAFWELSSIDPLTNELPENPLVGFLPPNENGVEGQGFFEYSVRSDQSAPTGGVIDAEATIVFDVNEPIDTPPIFNTLDADDPTSAVGVLAIEVPDPTFLVEWSGSDIGSGLDRFTIFVAENGRPFEIWLEDTTLTSAPYVGKEGLRYDFYSVSQDNGGNLETAPSVPDATTMVFSANPPELSSITRSVPTTAQTAADRLTFRATFSVGVNDVDASDFVVAGTSGTLIEVAQVSPGEYDIVISGGDLPQLNGDVSLSLSPTNDITGPGGHVSAAAPAIDESFTLVNRSATTDRVGIYRFNLFYADVNGNGSWDGVGGGDLYSIFEDPNATPVIGDWNGDGIDNIGIHRNRSFYLDLNGNGIWDGAAGGDGIRPFGNPDDTPVVGDWNGDGIDDIGIHRNRSFYLDQDGNGMWESHNDVIHIFGNSGDTPIIGDWNGDGTDNIGVHRGRRFYRDFSGNGQWDGQWDGLNGDLVTTFGNADDLPIIGDWNGDGADEIGIHRNRHFYRDLNGNGIWDGPSIDIVSIFGIAGDTPIIGKWVESFASGATPGDSAVMVSDTASGTGFLMFSAENVKIRFSKSPLPAANSEHVVVVQFSDEQWFYNDNQHWTAFSPRESDRLLSRVDLAADTVTNLNGQSGSFAGISLGYLQGDLTFHANELHAIPNVGEFTVKGTYFEYESDNGPAAAVITPARFSGDLRSSDFTFDTNGDGRANALDDGIQIIRYLAGIEDQSFRFGETERDFSMDIDGDGFARALTDGILMMRYMANFRGDALVKGVVSPDAVRNDAASIEAWLSQFVVASPAAGPVAPTLDLPALEPPNLVESTEQRRNENSVDRFVWVPVDEDDDPEISIRTARIPHVSVESNFINTGQHSHSVALESTDTVFASIWKSGFN